MSDWRGHLKTGMKYQSIALIIIVCIYLYLAVFPSILELGLLIPILILSPLLPDIDHQSSKITLFFYLIGVLSLWIMYFLFNDNLLYSIIFLSIVVIFSQFVPHRTISHNVFIIACLHLGIAYFTHQYTLSFLYFYGIYSHFVADDILPF